VVGQRIIRQFLLQSAFLKGLALEKYCVKKKQKHKPKRYCLCDQILYWEICCDNELCPIEWFHFYCVSLSTKPKGKWFCPKCRGDRPNIIKYHLICQYLMKREEPPDCTYCGSLLTVKHVLTECWCYEKETRELNLPGQLSESHSPEQSNLTTTLEFLHNAGLYSTKFNLH